MDGGAWWATVHGVTKSRPRLSNFTSLSLFDTLLMSNYYSHCKLLELVPPPNLFTYLFLICGLILQHVGA